MRRRILDAARELFLQGGDEAVTLRAVAQRIEYAPGTIYLHFDSKEAMIHELCAEDTVVLVRSLKQAQERTEYPLEQLRQLSMAYVEFGLRHSMAYQALFSKLIVSSVGSIKENKTLKIDTEIETPVTGSQGVAATAYALLRAGVSKALAAECFRPEWADADEITQILWSGLHGAVGLQLLRKSAADIPWRTAGAVAEGLVSCILAGLTRKE